jgi:Fic family protein
VVILIKESDDHDLFRFITDRNLLTQYDTLEVSVEVALKEKIAGITHDLIKDLNAVATKYISEFPGEYRRCPIYIDNSTHVPPAHDHVLSLMQDTVQYICGNWTGKSAIHLAAYALWRVNWIHPFVEGNGRTARAICYYILCVGNGMWLPGANIIPQQIRANRQPYYEALREADTAYENQSAVDVSVLEAYLSGLLTVQLR